MPLALRQLMLQAAAVLVVLPPAVLLSGASGDPRFWGVNATASF